MTVKLENSLKFNSKVDDVFYVSVFNSSAEEIIPVEVDFEEIFYDFLDIKTVKKITTYSDISINLRLFDNLYSMTGKIINGEIIGSLYWYTVKIDSIPTELFDEIVSMIKNEEIKFNEKNRGLINF